MRLVMASPQLRRIVLAYTVNRLGGWFGLLALVLAVYDHTHSALAVSALLCASLAVPALIVPAVVARVEASKRRGELSGLYLFEAIATAGLAVLMWHFSLPAILGLVVLDGIAALAASALLRAEVARAARDWVQEEAQADGRPNLPGELDGRAEEAERNANAALNLGFSATFVLGPALGSALVAAAGAPTALFIDVGSFLLGALLLVDLHPHVDSDVGDSVLARLRAARAHLAESPMLRRLFAAEFLALVFIETGAPIEVTYVKSTLGAGDRGVGILLAMWGAGGVAGSVVFARLVKWPLRILLGAGSLCIGAAYFGLAAAPSLLLACVAGLLGGIGNGMQWPSLISAVQKLTPENLQGRLMGATESLGALCVAVGLPLGGALVAISSPRAAFVVVGIGALAGTLALLRIRIAGTRDGEVEQPSTAPAFDEPHAPARERVVG
jgi:predicted MFS family arabinose efflux permease